MSSRRTTTQQYDDDFFNDSRMSFGEHIEELRRHLWLAIIGLVFFMIIGFFLDGLGSLMGWKNFGIGKPAMEIIKAPVTQALREFRDDRVNEIIKQHEANDPELAKLNEPKTFDLYIPPDSVSKLTGRPTQEEGVTIQATMKPLDVALKLNPAIAILGKQPELTTLSVQEGFVVYFKVSLVCGIVLSSPWIFWQIWSFVAAGLYPHEKKYVHMYLPFSLGLFLAGVALCQFVVLPKAVSALLTFNSWLGLEPDLRLNEWLTFAILMPLVFGISFQTPLVMLFLNRLGLFKSKDYWSKWRYALMFIAVFAAVITPTPDALSMSFLAVPMFGLYGLGVLLCAYSERFDEADIDVPDEEEVAV